jgi:hypothetical protein
MEIEDKIAAQARRVAITRQNLSGAKVHNIAIAATNHYLRAREELERLNKIAAEARELEAEYLDGEGFDEHLACANWPNCDLYGCGELND